MNGQTLSAPTTKERKLFSNVSVSMPWQTHRSRRFLDWYVKHAVAANDHVDDVESTDAIPSIHNLEKP